jgi:acetyl esterase/lipase
MRHKVNKDLLAYYDMSPEFDFLDITKLRALVHEAEMAALRDDPHVHVYESTIAGPPDNPHLRVRIYEPVGRTNLLPGVLLFHGGGFFFGSVARHEALCQRYCKEAHCVVLSVDYRLAPENKFPAATEDAYSSLVWLARNGAQVGVDTTKIATAGISAGGNLVAALSLITRDRQGPQIVLQILLYPALDHRCDTVSCKEIRDKKILSNDHAIIAWSHYLEDGKEVSCYASPALAADFSGLPPTFVYVGELDPLRDENIAYATNLTHAGVPVEFHLYPGCFHAFDLIVPTAEYSRHATEAAINALRRAFE